jgi:hypothetical protein
VGAPEAVADRPTSFFVHCGFGHRWLLLLLLLYDHGKWLLLLLLMGLGWT